jgi:dipeptidyl aminopeptidase/acylaminoacyl peptidase
LAGDLEQARQKHILASPLNGVTPNAAPRLCIHRTEDKYVAHEQAVWLIDRLKSAGVEAHLLTLEGAGHEFKGKVGHGSMRTRRLTRGLPDQSQFPAKNLSE